MNCFAITTSYRQTKIRADHIFQTRYERVHFVNIAFSEITVNHRIMKFSDFQEFYFSSCEIFSENVKNIAPCTIDKCYYHTLSLHIPLMLSSHEIEDWAKVFPTNDVKAPQNTQWIPAEDH